jgi:hypothetical protein
LPPTENAIADNSQDGGNGDERGQPRYDHQKTNPRHDRRRRRVIVGSLARGEVCFVLVANALNDGRGKLAHFHPHIRCR